jgi:hypothetical protein
MTKKYLYGIGLASLVIALSLYFAMKNCKTQGKSILACSSNCTSLKNNNMKTESGTCPKCGKDSCNSSCSSSESTVNGISDKLCSTKTMDQIKVEADMFKKMDSYKKISSVLELKNGYEFVYKDVSPGLRLELIDMLKLELKCCPTYDYAMIVDAKTNTIHYQRYGSDTIKSELTTYLKMIDLIK